MKKLARLAFVVLIIPWWLVFQGCLEEKHDKTPAGYQVKWKDQGTISTGLHTQAEIYAIFDAAMLRAESEIESKWGIKKCGRFFREDGYLFVLEDHFHFRALGLDYPNSSWATGYWSGEMIQLAFYNREQPASQSTIDQRAWTLYTGPQTGNLYGGAEVDGSQFPALTWELENGLGFWTH